MNNTVDLICFIDFVLVLILLFLASVCTNKHFSVTFVYLDSIIWCAIQKKKKSMWGKWQALTSVYGGSYMALCIWGGTSWLFHVIYTHWIHQKKKLWTIFTFILLCLGSGITFIKILQSFELIYLPYISSDITVYEILLWNSVNSKPIQ